MILLGATKLVLFGHTLLSLSCVPIVHMVKKNINLFYTSTLTIITQNYFSYDFITRTDLDRYLGICPYESISEENEIRGERFSYTEEQHHRLGRIHHVGY